MQLTQLINLRQDGLYWKDSGERVGCLNDEGYRVFGYNGVQLKEHREVFNMVNGYYPKQVDHKNGIKSDNRPSNLRDATAHQNQYNRRDVLGYRKKRNRYEARITYEGKRLALGSFGCATAARLAYLKAAKELYGEWFSKGELC